MTFLKILIDIPNQINPKGVFLEGFGCSREIVSRVYAPIRWPTVFTLRKDNAALIISDKRNLKINERKTMVLEFTKESEIVTEQDKERVHIRKLLISSAKCKNEKPGAFDISPLVTIH